MLWFLRLFRLLQFSILYCAGMYTHALQEPIGSGGITVAGSSQDPTLVRSNCAGCEANTYSMFGFVCLPCDLPSVVDQSRAICSGCRPGRGWNEDELCNRDNFATLGPACDANSTRDRVCVDCTGTGTGFDFSPTGVCTHCAAPNVINAEHTTCTACAAGYGPNENRTACNPCTGIYYSTTGVCQECLEPSVVNPDHTFCAPPFKCNVGTECPIGVDCEELRDCVNCDPGSASVGTAPCEVCNASGEVAAPDQSLCVACYAGQEPNTDRTQCRPCQGNTISTFGIQCGQCQLGYLANSRHSICNDEDECAENNGNCDRRTIPVAQGANETCSNSIGSYRCGLCPKGFVQASSFDEDERLNGTRCFLPPIEGDGGTGASALAAVQPSLSLQVEVVKDAAAAERIRGTLAESLGVSPGSIDVVLEAPEGRRHLQAQERQQATIAVLVPGDAGLDLLDGMMEGLQDPESTLLQILADAAGVSVPPGQVLSVDYECPRGTVTDGNQCRRCPEGEYSNTIGAIDCDSCVSWSPGSTNNPTTTACQCMPGYYSTMSPSPQPWCYNSDMRAVPSPSWTKCEQLSKSKLAECVEDATGAQMDILPGWTLVFVSDTKAILKCRNGESCPGGIVNESQPTIPCTEGYTGLLCGECIDDYALKADGACKKCAKTTWQGLVVVAIVVALGALAATRVKAW
eukprot:SAG22_NODE_381_length_11354_cov_6.529631_4_plen_688_part_00